VALTLDHHTLEYLRAPAGALDHLKVNADAIAGLELRHAAQLRTLEAFDDAAHE
jgi:hypothetical protein